MLTLALLMRNTQVNQVTIENYGMSCSPTPGKSAPGADRRWTIGFVTPRLPDTPCVRRPGVHQLCPSEIFAIGAFCSVEVLIFPDGWLSTKRLEWDSPWLFIVGCSWHGRAGGTAMIMERVAYRPPRRVPRLVPSSPPSASRFSCKI
jgi:hypothetical protein